MDTVVTHYIISGLTIACMASILMENRPTSVGDFFIWATLGPLFLIYDVINRACEYINGE